MRRKKDIQNTLANNSFIRSEDGLLNKTETTSEMVSLLDSNIVNTNRSLSSLRFQRFNVNYN